jgi:hypothetical protein
LPIDIFFWSSGPFFSSFPFAGAAALGTILNFSTVRYKFVNIKMGYTEDLCVRALNRRLADNIQLDRFVSNAWYQTGGLIA